MSTRITWHSPNVHHISTYLPNTKILSTKIKEVHVGNSFGGRPRIVILNERISSTYSRISTRYY